MALKLYYSDVSPAARGSLLAVKALGIENIEYVPVNLMVGEQMKPEFLKINPFHSVPTLTDGDFSLWNSHAINCYLADKFGTNESLYPKDLQKRATIHQRLFFDDGVLFPRMGRIVLSLLKEGAKTINKDMADMLTQAYGQLETLLEQSTYVAGEDLTIADFSIIATVTSSNALVPIAANRFPKINEYIARMQSLPYYKEANQKGLDIFAGAMKSKLA